jgi:YD repeat-containing protein
MGGNSVHNLGDNTVTKPSQVTVQNGSNTTVSLTNYTYDEAQYLTGTSGVLNHGTPPSSRGNATTVSRWVSGSTYITAHTNFYDTGVPFNTIDPNTSSTQYAYMCQSAYPNTITAPASLTTTLNWDCNTGLLTSATDPNGQPTTYHYDSEGRTTEIDFADGGQLNSAYDLSSTPPNIRLTIVSARLCSMV